MSTNPEGFSVILETFARKHYCKEFEKKYAQWHITWKGLEEILARFNPEALSGKLEPPIKRSADGSLVLCKMSFRIAGTDTSAKSSGNRLIFVCNNSEQVIRVLLVYNKNDIKGKRETDWWMGLVYDQYNGLP